jgi:DnaK suppressor protein
MGGAPNLSPRENLKRILEERRRAISDDLRHGLRESCDGTFSDGADGVLDPVDSGELSFQDEIRFALISMKTQTLIRIDDALARLADGRYGRCDDCGQDIPEARLRAMPFALRCTRCEELRENTERQRQRSGRLMGRLREEEQQYKSDG